MSCVSGFVCASLDPGHVSRTWLAGVQGAGWRSRLTKPAPFKIYETRGEIILISLTVCARFPLSQRNVENLPHGRGIGISLEAVRL